MRMEKIGDQALVDPLFLIKPYDMIDIEHLTELPIALSIGG